MIISFDCKDDFLLDTLNHMIFEDRDLALTAFMNVGLSGFLDYMEKIQYDRTNFRSH